MLVCLWTGKKFSPDSIRVNFEVLKLFIYAWIVMKFALNDKSKGFYRFPGDKFLNFILFFPEIGS